jgi:hypothetical protein
MYYVIVLVKLIKTISGKKFAYPNDFRKSLENGVILCELVNALKKDCIRRINRHSTQMSGLVSFFYYEFSHFLVIICIYIYSMYLCI